MTCDSAQCDQNRNKYTRRPMRYIQRQGAHVVNMCTPLEYTRPLL